MNFHWKASKLSFRAFLSRRSDLAQTIDETHVDFEVAHSSVLMVWRLQYGRFLPYQQIVGKSYPIEFFGLRAAVGCYL